MPTYVSLVDFRFEGNTRRLQNDDIDILRILLFIVIVYVLSHTLQIVVMVIDLFRI